MTGDIIIMPIDISRLATTMSMIRKGMNRMKPIWKAVFSSLITKAGIRMRSGVSSGFSILSMRATPANIAMSASRV